MAFPLAKSDAQWKKELTQSEYNCLREAGTETPGTGEYHNFFPEDGYFACRACKQPLYSSKAKFKDCGWEFVADRASCMKSA